jgi:hypothetical protein
MCAGNVHSGLQIVGKSNYFETKGILVELFLLSIY